MDEVVLDVSGRTRARIAVLGDTHGVLDPRVRDALVDIDAIVHTGDVGAADVLEQLGAIAPVLAVRGNNDIDTKWEGPLDVLGALPERGSVRLPGGVLAVEHGHRAGAAKTRHEKLRARHPEARVVAYGHSHHLVLDDAERPWVLNPGAAGRARTFGGPSFAVLEARSRGRWTCRLERLLPQR